MKRAALRRALVAWFRRGHRQMPWRETRDPYGIWVSEIMLQQTRVETVREYWLRWMARLPTVRSLAAAPLDEVLGLWSGLGYYARARNLKAAAELLCAEDGGHVPRDPARLRALPGIGEYTAGAIASIAFGLPEPILDGNVARVLARVFLVEGAADDRVTRATLWGLARELVPADAAADFNQGLMELGATLCTPRAPACERCPLARGCQARASGRQEELPRPKARRAVPTVQQHAVLVTGTGEERARLLLGRRPTRGLWGGLWEPPCLPVVDGEAEAGAAARASARFGVRLSRVRALPEFAHTLTHRRYQFHPLAARGCGTPVDRERGYDALRWVDPGDLERLGLSAWARRALEGLDER